MCTCTLYLKHIQMIYMYMCIQTHTVHVAMNISDVLMAICTCMNYCNGVTVHEIHVPSMLAIGVEMINKQTQQTNKQPQWLIKFIKHSHKGLRKY